MNHPIQNRDKLRAILTDLIPYEVPLRFSFLHMHSLFASSDAAQGWTKRLIDKAASIKSALPYLYSIKRSEGKERTLGLIHPLILEDAARLYSGYDGVILSLCKKSSWSLRHPSKTAKMYFSREDVQADSASGNIDDTEDDADHQEAGLSPETESMVQKNASSYFIYEPFNLLQKFFESRELIKIEKRFSKCRRVDIAKCFDNIYSHSFSWAVKGKAAAKADKMCAHTFDAKFDAFMQRSNHRETHGILIGSEFSRVFAEIILQDIDARAREKLQNGSAPAGASPTPSSIVDGREYTIRRYIDDYFIFHNDTSVADEAQAALESVLASYKLFLNERKTSDLSRPFTTTISAAKREIRDYINSNLDFNEVVRPTTEGDSSAQLNSRFYSEKILCGIRLILTARNVSMSEISAPLLKQLNILAQKKLPLFKTDQPFVGCAYSWIRCILEISFFFFSVDMRFRLSVLTGRLITQLAETIPLLPAPISNDIEDVILRETTAILTEVIDTKTPCRLEMVNFLICLRGIRRYWRIPESLIKSFLSSAPYKKREYDYFTIVSLLYFTGERAEYNQLRSVIETAGLRLVHEATNLIDDAELVGLSLDLMSCPSVSRPAKDLIAAKLIKSLGTPSPTISDCGAMVNEFSRRTWLFDWRSTASNSCYLQKKELSLSY